MKASFEHSHYKDQVLDQLAARGNVAQFVSFAPQSLQQRFSRIAGHEPNQQFATIQTALATLLDRSPERSVNVRSFEPRNPKSRTFHYGLRTVDETLGHLRTLADQGLYTIVNETIDVRDGGVSGVYFGGVFEFAPGETPRCVEGPDAAELPSEWALQLFQTVYGFEPTVPIEEGIRVEFSLHPLRRGYFQDHTVLWEREEIGNLTIEPRLHWPNKFSRHVGDKAFGLLIAHLAGLPVPLTRVIPRGLPPFAFGESTGTGETWIRTCPREQIPGKHPTKHGWLDPFKMMQVEDPTGELLASVLAQEGVESEYSGALVTTASGVVHIEGVAGAGEAFMQGRSAPQRLPAAVTAAVTDTYETARKRLGPVRMEWVYDGSTTWVVQLHRGTSPSEGRVIFPGSPSSWKRLPVEMGIDILRAAIAELSVSGSGLILEGDIGITSHMADLLRRAQIPSKIERAEQKTD